MLYSSLPSPRGFLSFQCFSNLSNYYHPIEYGSACFDLALESTQIDSSEQGGPPGPISKTHVPVEILRRIFVMMFLVGFACKSHQEKGTGLADTTYIDERHTKRVGLMRREQADHVCVLLMMILVRRSNQGNALFRLLGLQMAMLCTFPFMEACRLQGRTHTWCVTLEHQSGPGGGKCRVEAGTRKHSLPCIV